MRYLKNQNDFIIDLKLVYRYSSRTLSQQSWL